MKVKDNEIVHRFHAAPDAIRLAVLCGPNATRCQALANELAAPLAESAERIDLTIADLTESAARLNDEATSASLFGRQALHHGPAEQRRSGKGDHRDRKSAGKRNQR